MISKVKYLGVGLAISLLLAGCTADKTEPKGDENLDKNENATTEEVEDLEAEEKVEVDTEKEETSKENEKENVEKDKEDSDKTDKEEESSSESSTTELSVDQETADLIEKDEGIEKAIVQLETVGDKKFVNGHIKLNTMMKGEETAEKYAKMLKKKHPGRTADMIITMDDKILYQGTF